MTSKPLATHQSARLKAIPRLVLLHPSPVSQEPGTRRGNIIEQPASRSRTRTRTRSLNLHSSAPPSKLKVQRSPMMPKRACAWLDQQGKDHGTMSTDCTVHYPLPTKLTMPCHAMIKRSVIDQSWIDYVILQSNDQTTIQ